MYSSKVNDQTFLVQVGNCFFLRRFNVFHRKFRDNWLRIR